MTGTEALFEKAAAGAELTDGERSALISTPDLLALGMAADDTRRRRHGRRMTFVRVATLDINTVDAATTTWPDAAGEVRLTGTPTDWSAAIASVQALVERAVGRVPVTGFSLADLEAAGAPIVAQLKGAGLAAVGDAPIDRLRDPEAALSMANDAGLAVLRLTVERAPAAVRQSMLDLAGSLAARWRSIQAFAPLPRLIAGDAPSTGYEDVRIVALARLLVDVPHVQVDWLLYGPKLAQVALTFGGDDVDGVSAVDDMSLGRRRAPLEEIRRNIVAASGEPAERDGLFGLRN
jgi:aminodeoxyfutalosine synthase